MTTTFENAKVGDRVFCLVYGEGVITECLTGLYVKFACGVLEYTREGKWIDLKSHTRTLFWAEPEITAPTQPPRSKNINGFKVPDIGFTPDRGAAYYYPAPNHHLMVDDTRYATAADSDEHRIKHNLCYPFTCEGRIAAVAHAKAWLGEGEPFGGAEQ